MTRSNPRIEFLEKENGFLREQIKRMREAPEEYPFLACDNSCAVARPRGMATNGGCRCDENKLRAALAWWQRFAVWQRSTIVLLSKGDAVADRDATIAHLIASGHAPEGAE